jgi:hypothetical protein
MEGKRKKEREDERKLFVYISKMLGLLLLELNSKIIVPESRKLRHVGPLI